MEVDDHLNSLKAPKSISSIIFDIFNHVLLGLFTLLCFFPIYYVFINTVSDNKLSSLGRVLFVPINIHFTNYVDVLKLQGLGQAAFMSVSRTVIGTLLTVICTSFLGYTLSKPKMWHRKLWYRFVIISMYFNAGVIPWFVTMKMLGLTNNFLGYILPGVISPFSLILFKTYVESLPGELEESAQLDGAGIIKTFALIVFPLCMPILATIAIFTSVGAWNSFIDTVLLMSKSQYFTLQFVLFQYLNEVNALATMIRQGTINYAQIDTSVMLTPTAVRLTVTMVVTFPILLIYPFFQKFFIKGIMIGAVKG